MTILASGQEKNRTFIQINIPVVSFKEGEKYLQYKNDSEGGIMESKYFKFSLKSLIFLVHKKH